MIIACDHPARGALGAAGRTMAMASRTELLDRLVTALARPGVDGLLATADIAEDLLLLGALEDKVVFASTNRGGLQGSAFEMDDRNTGYDVPGVIEAGFDGAKMLVRIDLDDPATVATLEQCGRGGERAQPGRADRHGGAVHVRAGLAARSSTTCPRRGDQVDPHRPGPGRVQRLHLAEAARGPRDGAGDGRHHAADPAARRRPGGGAGRDVRRLAGRAAAAVGARPGGRPHHALPGG